MTRTLIALTFGLVFASATAQAGGNGGGNGGGENGGANSYASPSAWSGPSDHATQQDNDAWQGQMEGVRQRNEAEHSYHDIYGPGR